MIKLTRFLSPLLGILLLGGIFGCGGGGSKGDRPVTTRSQYGPLELTLTLPKTTYRRAETVRTTLTVKNTSSNRVVCAVTGPDVRVTQNEVLVFLDAGGGSTLFGVLVFQPGETLTNNLIWLQTDVNKQSVSPGRYTITADFNATDIFEDTKEPLRPSGKSGERISAPPVEITVQ